MVAREAQVTANVHITPMRASRALALRYLATKFGVDMEALAVRATCLHFRQAQTSKGLGKPAVCFSHAPCHCTTGTMNTLNNP